MNKPNAIFDGLIDFIKNGAVTKYDGPAVLTEETLHHLIDNLQRYSIKNANLVDELAPHHFEQNGCEEKIMKTFGFSKNDKLIPSVTTICGYPVYTRKYVPEGEMWTCSRSGRVIKRIKLL